MATIDNKGMVHGTAGAVVYRTYRGKNILQGKAKSFKQTEKTISSATEFGLSSSAAKAIRNAFEPAFYFKDGTAAYRSTQLVYRSILNNVSGEKGKRDLHDGDLSLLRGMDFNANSKLLEVMQMSHSVSKSADGLVHVTLGSLNTKTGIKRPKGASGAYMKHRIRLMLVAFNFREEYYENLGVRDVDLEGYQSVEGQVITFNEAVPEDCLALVSLSLMLYSTIEQTNESILLNNKEFSPCAIIGAFQSEQPSEYPTEKVNFQPSDFTGRETKVKELMYKGNLLMLGLRNSITEQASMNSNKVLEKEFSRAGIQKGRVSFKKE